MVRSSWPTISAKSAASASASSSICRRLSIPPFAETSSDVVSELFCALISARRRSFWWLICRRRRSGAARRRDR